MLAVAAWRLHRTVGGQLSQLEFLNGVLEGLLVAEASEANGHFRGPRSPVSSDMPIDGIGHYLEDDQKRGRYKLCKKNTAQLRCIKCRVRLHQPCSMTFYEPINS